MPDNRFFVEDKFSLNESIVITGREHYHLYRVMRKRVGEQIEIVNGQGDLIEATLKEVDDESAELLIHTIKHFDPPTKTFRLIQGIPNIARLETLLEKCTELGCSEYWLYFASKSERRLFSEQKIERLRYIIISALKQCGAYYLPKMVLFEKIDEITPPDGPLFFGDLRPTAPKITSSPESCTFINGPESGFTDEEMAYFESKWDAKGISLHQNQLRTETAAITAAAFFST